METLPAWPDELGLPLNNGYKHTLETVSATAMTAGISRARRTIAQPASEFSIRFRWHKEQLARFRQFVRDDINGATGWFTMPLWSGGGIEPHPVRIKSANPYQLELPYWSMSLTLECRERFRLSDEVGDTLLEWDIKDLINAGNIIEGSMCEMGNDTGCYGGYSVLNIASLFNESKRNLCQIFKNWDTC